MNRYKIVAIQGGEMWLSDRVFAKYKTWFFSDIVFKKQCVTFIDFTNLILELVFERVCENAQ